MRLSDLVLKKGRRKIQGPDQDLFDCNGSYRVYNVDFINSCYEVFTYENCQYVGTINNPYLILVKAGENPEGDIVVHPNTVGIAPNAFYDYKSWIYPKDKERINEVILGENINCTLYTIECLKAKGVIIHTKNIPTFNTLGAYAFTFSDYVYAPKVDLLSICRSEIRVKIVNGFFLKQYKGSETAENNKYIEYLEKHVSEFYQLFKCMPRVFDYVLSHVLISYEDTYDLMCIYEHDEEIYNRLIKYREENYLEEYEKEKANPLTFEDLEDCLDITGYYSNCSSSIIHPPYYVVENVNSKIVNEKGYEYELSDILDLFNRIFINNTMWSQTIHENYKSYYLKDNKTKLEGFKKEEIDRLIWDYYKKRPGYTKAVIIFDTWWIKDNKMYMLSREWLKLFYETLVKHPLIDYKFCCDVVPKKNKAYFSEFYYLPDALMRCFVKAVDISSTFERFMTLIRNLFENKTDLMIKAQYLEKK